MAGQRGPLVTGGAGQSGIIELDPDVTVLNGSVIDGLNEVTVGLTNATCFFRLRKQ